MVESPRVSVLLPVYDGERHLREALASVLAQRCEAFEVVALDDASRDGSRAILKAHDDPRLRVVCADENRGLFPTLNRLLELSRAPLVRLWAQDDVMYPGALQAHLDFHTRHPQLAMSYCDFDTIDELGRVVPRTHDDHTPELVHPALAGRIMLRHGSIAGNIANVMLRRSALDEVGTFREDLRVSGDFEMWVRLTRHHDIGRLPRRLMALRAHPGQLSRRPGIVARFAEENGPIYAELIGRLPLRERAAARARLRREVHVGYAHDIVRSALRGDLEGARETLRALSGQDRPLPVFAWWLLTANRRWLRRR